MLDVILHLSKYLDGAELRPDEPLKKHSGMRCGGKAALFLRPKSVEKLLLCLEALQGRPRFVLGGGQNTLFAGDFEGGVVCTLGLKGIRRCGDRLTVNAGETLAEAAAAAQREGLGGLEAVGTVPGTFGGGICMNAGCFGSQISDLLTSVTVFDGKRIRTLAREDCAFFYRHSLFSEGECVIISGELSLRPAPPAEIADRRLALFRLRRQIQPREGGSLGSVFKNPPGDFAGRLIEACGFRGKRFRGVQVSEKHANFLINRSGTADDVLALMARIRRAVSEKFGVDLEPEIVVVRAWEPEAPRNAPTPG